MKKRIKKMISAFLIVTLILSGCGSKTKMIFENVPDPIGYFSENANIVQYEADNMKCINIEASEEDDVEEIFSQYTTECEKLDVWTKIVFVGDHSWCYTTEDELYRLSINWWNDEDLFCIWLTKQGEEE